MKKLFTLRDKKKDSLNYTESYFKAVLPELEKLGCKIDFRVVKVSSGYVAQGSVTKSLFFGLIQVNLGRFGVKMNPMYKTYNQVDRGAHHYLYSNVNHQLRYCVYKQEEETRQLISDCMEFMIKSNLEGKSKKEDETILYS